MSKTRDTGNIGNVVKVDASGNVSFVSGSTTLATINTSGQLSGSSPVLSSSYASNAETLDGLDSTQFTLTSSFAAQTASFTAFTSSILSYTSSANSRFSSIETVTGSNITRLSALEVATGSLYSYTSSLNNKTSSFATTGSNTFEGIQTINSNLIVTGSITAQTLVVQTITSSVNFVTGSTRFGSILGNTHVFSGSVTMNPGGLFVSSSGNVGIGTINPTPRDAGALVLELYGTSSGRSSLKFTNSTSGTGATDGMWMGYDSGLNFTMINNEVGHIALATSNTERMRISSAGVVGIGVTPTTWYTTDYNIKALQIGSAGALFNLDVTSSNLRLYLSNNSYVEPTSAAQTYIVTGAATSFSQENGAFFFRQAASGTAGTPITFTTPLTIASTGAATFSGFVGINGSPATGFPLEAYINSSTAYSSTSRGNVMRVYNSNTSANIFAGIELGGAGTANDGLAGLNAVVTGSGSAALTFYTRDSNTFAERLRITSGGNVGIGTSSPSGKLMLYQSTAGNVLQNIVSNQGGSTQVGINLSPSMTDTEVAANPAQASIYATDSNYGANIIFATKATGAVGNALTTRLTIASSGATTITSNNTVVGLTVNGGNSSDGTVAKFARGGDEKNFYISSTNNQFINLATEGDIRLRTGCTVDQPYATGVNALILASTGAATFSSSVKATNFTTISSQATISASSTATILTLSSSAVGVYIVQGNFGGQGNAAYGSTLIVVANSGDFRIVTNGSGSNSALTLSGANVQIQNVLGINLDAYASAILIGN